MREVVYADDVTRVVLDLLDSDEARVVVGSGQHVSVRQMAETVALHLGFTGRIVWETDKPGGQKTRPPAQPRPFAYTTFDEGVRRTCDWFRSTTRTCGSKVDSTSFFRNRIRGYAVAGILYHGSAKYARTASRMMAVLASNQLIPVV